MIYLLSVMHRGEAASCCHAQRWSFILHTRASRHSMDCNLLGINGCNLG